MLHWVGKQSPKMAQYFPAQLREKIRGGGENPQHWDSLIARL